ncbi:MAG: SDR family oxidoreductase, partial [Leptospiraceae bacterium]|nr:SDR family oxidoreductase [Leptospiraceae bacterium]
GVKFAGSSHSTIYSASKRALEGFAMSLSRQGAAKGILSNVIRVGVTDTRIHRVPGKVMEARKEMIPLKRMASPDEIAGATMFLLGPDAAFITGAIIPVSGGE